MYRSIATSKVYRIASTNIYYLRPSESFDQYENVCCQCKNCPSRGAVSASAHEWNVLHSSFLPTSSWSSNSKVHFKILDIIIDDGKSSLLPIIRLIRIIGGRYQLINQVGLASLALRCDLSSAPSIRCRQTRHRDRAARLLSFSLTPFYTTVATSTLLWPSTYWLHGLGNHWYPIIFIHQ